MTRSRTLFVLIFAVLCIAGYFRNGHIAHGQGTLPPNIIFLPLVDAGTTNPGAVETEAGNDVPGLDPGETLEEEQPGQAPAVPGQFVVMWKSDVEAVHSAEVMTATPGFNIDLIDLSGMTRAGLRQSADDILESYRNDPNVLFVEPNYIYTATITPNDPDIGRQWAWPRIGAFDAWDITQGTEDTKIAVIDTGVDLDHPDLVDRLVGGYDFVDNRAGGDDGNGHGTHVAGTAAATSNNNLFGSGVCPQCSIMPLRALDDRGSGTLSDIASAITYATDNGAKVINMSLGARFGSDILREAVDYAWSNGVFITCAAGNSGVRSREYPAGYDNCMAVAATTNQDVKASFSNYGTWVKYAAPGASIYSTYFRGDDATFSGTSMAAPHVAGLAGLLSSQGLDNDQIRDRICDTADPITQTGSSWECGRINMLAALSVDNEQPEPDPTPEPPSTPEPSPEPTSTPEPTPEPTSTPEPTPEPTETPDPGETPPANSTLIDGSFEQGTGWTYSNQGIRSTSRAYVGRFSAQLGGENNSADSIEQTVIVPQNAILSYAWRAQGAWDFGDTLVLEITLMDGSGATYTITHSAWRGWWFSRRYDLSPLAGKPIRLRYSADTNGSSVSTFFVDSVSLE